jgi:RNA polymerase sigma-70 factor (ECF subfamily)
MTRFTDAIVAFATRAAPAENPAGGLNDYRPAGVDTGEPMQPTEATSPGRERDRTGDSGPSPEGAAFEDFFRAEHPRLYRTLYLATGSAHEADELAQEAFLKVWERWERVREMDEPRGYLYRIAMNAFRSRLRRAARAARRVFDRPPPPEDPFALADLRDEVVQRLRALPERQRLALVLTDLGGLPAEDAARALGVGASTVRSLASQGRASIRATAGEEESDA